MITLMKYLMIFFIVFVVSAVSLTVDVSAEETVTGSGNESSKLLGAGLAFGLAAGGAGIGLGYVGSAGLAVISENPSLQSKVFIFIGMVESIAIYGIVMMFIIIGQ